jgi:hypothetical protein
MNKDNEYDSFLRLKKLHTKMGTKVISGKPKRIKDKEREEIENGILEYEEEINGT